MNFSQLSIKEIFKPIDQVPNYNWRRGSPSAYLQKTLRASEKLHSCDLSEDAYYSLVEKFFQLPFDYLLIDLFAHTSIDPINFLRKIEDDCWKAGISLNIDWVGMEIYLKDRRLDKLMPPERCV
tara:strand:- start:135 stop:506 length:372 start_codon:yes stop_codon:yes gene_type:complete